MQGRSFKTNEVRFTLSTFKSKRWPLCAVIMFSPLTLLGFWALLWVLNIASKNHITVIQGITGCNSFHFYPIFMWPYG